jgi:hypothetical protein
MRTRQRENRLGAVASAMVALAVILAACSRDLSVNNLTLTPKPDGLPKKSDWSQAWGRSSSGTVTTADLVSSRGQCPLPPRAPGQSAMAGQAQAELGGIALEMSECEVVHRTGPVEKMEVGTTGRGERSLVLTYLKGPWPGVYRFTAGPPGIDRASAGCPGAVREGSHPQQKTRRKLRLGTSRETAVIPGPRVEGWVPVRAACIAYRPVPASAGARHDYTGRQGPVSDDGRVCRVRACDHSGTSPRWAKAGQGRGGSAGLL